MARKPKTTTAPKDESGIGHNSSFDNLTDEQFADLRAYYQVKITQAQDAAAVLKAKLDEAKGVVNALMKRMTADTKVERKQFVEFLTDLNMPETERLLKLARRARLYRDIDPGAQFDLFGQTKDVVSDKQEAYDAGARAFMRSEYGTPPDELHPMFHQDWLAGYHAKQEETAARMARAVEFLGVRDENEDGEEAGADDDGAEESEEDDDGGHAPSDPLLN